MQTNDTVPEVTTAAPATPEVASVTPEIVESPSTGAPPASGPPNLEETLKQAQQQAEEYHDAWLRAKAETENVRRRAQEDISKAAKFAVDRFARELLAVKDSLEAALATETASVESLRSGTELTLRQLVAAFEKSALTEVNPLGEKFDPHRHQAISVVESPQEPNTVVSVLQKGYLLADRVLRPALVVVARASA
ncbi:MAG TPA: nucleotide exchange factor GrpE [Accumulibacter sp.]|uniref:Protein GrpE n=2 Tax=Candidatus Accumulibacter TaxID=327159 RepID=A0A080M6S0_9PROT|nr:MULTISPECIES: nucleotide exchange factor GrpE [Candidatus Accumulibacter]KFB76180.1 MAG: HSP-70 cofactor [Candidatus Accumulibacter cognatus]MBL8400409.1 nucleotide exchange factor GrpE [Accumulibacter sp.]MCC2869690.1 nucleotide exchange factor GrpE [Candidatus Accumulibacter phosphatis]MCM8621222.1 nucleotide exchange factor GrpE [Accumulibacter sp.]MCQ1550942.1 nucleotide exchange factor GrpE [Candidatus Accumulibacter phosphatis]